MLKTHLFTAYPKYPILPLLLRQIQMLVSPANELFESGLLHIPLCHTDAGRQLVDLARRIQRNVGSQFHNKYIHS